MKTLPSLLSSSFIFALNFIFILNSIYLSQCKDIPNPVVNITNFGSFKGEWQRTKWTFQKFAQFVDIPYTEKTDRFQPPKPKEKFEDQYDATTGRGVCLSFMEIVQYDDFYDSDWEYCQYLTIFTKTLNPASKKAVMVHIAGYNLEESTTSEGAPEYLLEEDIVYITVQHRVGPFGFLSTESEEIPGNVGILDVIEALRFIKKFIKYFGGDEENVTVFGQYKTAAIIHLISMTQIFREEKLFQKMILQSGSALMDGLAIEDSKEMAEQIGEYLECKEDVPLDDCLKNAKMAELADAYKKYQDENPRISYFTIGGASNLIESSIEEIAEYAEFHGVGVMGGVVKHPAIGSGAIKSFKSLGKLTLEFAVSLSEDKEFEDYRTIIKQKFPEAAFLDVFERALWPAIIDLNSLDIKESIAKTLKYISSSNISTYMYIFNYHGALHRLPEIDNDEFDTVALTDDNLYIFPHPEQSLNKQDKKIAKIMIKLWTSFAQNSIPKAEGYVDNWPKVIKDTLGPYLKIDNIMEIGWNFPEEFFTSVLETKRFLENV